MIKKILILSIILLLAFSGLSGAVMWDLKEIITGKQMVPDDNSGAPWLADSSKLYFGTGQDAYFTYVPSTDKVYLNDTDLTVEEDLVVGGTATIAGTPVSSGTIADDVVITGTHKFTSGTGVGGVNGVWTVKNDTKLIFGTQTSPGLLYLRYVSSGNYFDIGGTPLLSGGFGWTGTATPTSGSDLVATGGASDIDYSLSSGIMKTPGGVFTVTNGGTVPTGKTWAITDADKLTVGSKIVPDRVTVTLPITNAMITAGEVNGSIFIASDAGYKVLAINEVHPVVETTAATASISVMKLTGTQTVASGTLTTTAAINLKSTAETVVSPALSATASDYTLAQGDRLGTWFKVTGVSSLSQFKRTCITVTLQRV